MQRSDRRAGSANQNILSQAGIAEREVVLRMRIWRSGDLRIWRSDDRESRAERLEGQMKSVVAQLSAIDVAALYHYHIWPEGRYQTLTENRESAIPESSIGNQGELSRVSGIAACPAQDKCLSSPSASESLAQIRKADSPCTGKKYQLTLPFKMIKVMVNAGLLNKFILSEKELTFKKTYQTLE
ncbi:uncharacterized protein Dsimw501_GD19197 [Drosophila simulans]|nr:uncharacterized protein Dsimw501_GD19197 [Drosophila simulans]